LRRAVFLGRDGVINRWAHSSDLAPGDSPANPDEFELLPGAGEAIAALNALRLPVVVVSNQPGIASGRLTTAVLDAINEKMRAELAKTGARTGGVLYCRHDPAGRIKAYRMECECRKPKPGMLFRAARERNLNLSQSFLVGNSAEDILAGHAAGVMTFLVSSGVSSAYRGLSRWQAQPDCIVADLGEAVRAIDQLLGSPSRQLEKASDRDAPQRAS